MTMIYNPLRLFFKFILVFPYHGFQTDFSQLREESDSVIIKMVRGPTVPRDNIRNGIPKILDVIPTFTILFLSPKVEGGQRWQNS
jgi:glutaredoxin-related protein